MKSIKRVRKTQPETKKKVIELEVGGWIGRRFASRGWGAFTFPLPFIVLILYWSAENAPDADVDALARVHEFTHVAQDEQTSCFAVMWARYAWESVRRLSWATLRHDGISQAFLEAYYANGYEAEAYMVEELAEKNGLPDWAA